jgi:chitin synthase
MLQFATQLSTAVFAWLNVANLFLTLLLIYGEAIDRAPAASSILKSAFIFCYCCSLFFLLVFSLAGNVNKLHQAYQFISIFYGTVMFFGFCFSIWLVSVSLSAASSMAYSGYLFTVFGLVASCAGYFIAAGAHGRLIDVASVFLQYQAMLPTLVNQFTIYSLCNTHDISW